MKNTQGGFTRRSFLRVIGATGLAATSTRAIGAHSVKNSFVTLFQGDSITDGNRGRDADPNHILGHGYAFSIASKLGAAYPGRNLAFINRGVSGDTVSGLRNRWQTDALELKPDLISILIGVNDVNHRIRSGKDNEPFNFEDELRALLEITRQSLPQTRIVLCEPFILPVGMVTKNPELWIRDIRITQDTVTKLSSEYNCILVRYQKVFDDATKKAPAEYWIWDGIHPTYNGHGLMAGEWLRAVGKDVAVLRDWR